MDSKVSIGVLVGVAVQAIAFVWYLSGLNSEVERVANVQAASLPPLKIETQKCAVAIHDQGQQIDRIKELTAETSGLDVLAFKVEELRKEIVSLREVDREIMTQHEKIFAWMANSSPMQQKGGVNPYGG